MSRTFCPRGVCNWSQKLFLTRVASWSPAQTLQTHKNASSPPSTTIPLSKILQLSSSFNRNREEQWVVGILCRLQSLGFVQWNQILQAGLTVNHVLCSCTAFFSTEPAPLDTENRAKSHHLHLCQSGLKHTTAERRVLMLTHCCME